MRYRTSLRRRRILVPCLIAVCSVVLTAGCGSSGSSSAATAGGTNNNTAATTTADAASTAASGASTPVSTGAAAPADWPKKPITFLVGFAAGAAVDVQARLFAKELKAEKGWNVVVKDAPGASGDLSVDDLSNAPADGYTFLLATRSFALSLMEPNHPRKLSQFIPVAQTASQAAGFATSASSSYKTLKDFVAAAKAKPGKITVGGPGALDIERVFEYEFAQQAGIELTWVPYDGGSKVVAALLSNKVDGGFAGASNFLPSVQANKLRILGLTAAPPYTPWPDQPTFGGSGYTMDESVWYGLFAKAGTDPGVVNALSDAVKSVTESSAWKDFLTKQQYKSDYLDSAAFRQVVEQQVQTDGPVVAKLHQITGS